MVKLEIGTNLWEQMVCCLLEFWDMRFKFQLVIRTNSELKVLIIILDQRSFCLQEPREVEHQDGLPFRPDSTRLSALFINL